jgi:hypothetical protein
MENGPHADFEVKFYDGWKIQYSARRKELEVTEPSPIHQHTTHSSERRPSPTIHRFDLERDLVDLVPPIATRFQHARDILRRCLDAERQSSTYPVVIRRRSNSSVAPVFSSESPSIASYDNDSHYSNIKTKAPAAESTLVNASSTVQDTHRERY